MDVITIPIQVIPDFQVYHNIDNGYAKKWRYSYLIDRQLVVIQAVDSNNKVVGYPAPRFEACRINDGAIQLIDQEIGWIKDEEATKLYMEIQAEKELLGESNSNLQK